MLRFSRVSSVSLSYDYNCKMFCKLGLGSTKCDGLQPLPLGDNGIFTIKKISL